MGSILKVTPGDFVLNNDLLEEHSQPMLKEVAQLLFNTEMTEQQERESPVPHQPYCSRRSVSRILSQANAAAAVVASSAQLAAARSAASFSNNPASGWTQGQATNASPWDSQHTHCGRALYPSSDSPKNPTSFAGMEVALEANNQPDTYRPTSFSSNK